MIFESCWSRLALRLIGANQLSLCAMQDSVPGHQTLSYSREFRDF